MVDLISVVMLYKKYHRNFVRQFKVGVKFSYETYRFHRDIVKREPYIGYGHCGIWMTGKEDGWILVFSDGKVEYKVKIEKDVI
mgnify:FL=1